jgi:CMP-N,N'-diacetyllegionaminic acid synthase
MHGNEIIAIIPIRSGSKRVPKKNLREVRGQPLFLWSVKAALMTPEIDRVILSTDDEAAIEIADSYPIHISRRPKHLATDVATTFDVIKNVCDEYFEEQNKFPGTVVLLQATSPLRERSLVSECVRKFRSDPHSDRFLELNQISLATGDISQGYWDCHFSEDVRSQDLPHLYFPSGRIFIYDYAKTIALNDAVGQNTGFVIADYGSSVNIDHEHDFDKLSLVLEREANKYEYLLD